MNNILIPVVSIVLGVTSTFAAAERVDGPVGHFYAGAGVSGVNYDDDNLFGPLLQDDSDVGLSVFGGYRATKHFGLEAELASFGQYSWRYDDAEFAATQLFASGYLPVAPNIDLSARIGYGGMSVDGVPGLDDDNVGVVTLGVGAEFRPLQHLMLRVGLSQSYFTLQAWETIGNTVYEVDYDQTMTRFGVDVAYRF